MLSEEDATPVASSSSAAQPSVTPKKSRKSALKPKARAKADHPKVSEMVMEAIRALNERKGSSVQAIKKYMSSQYKVDVEKLAPFVRKALKSGVDTYKLVQTRGKGASGSFKLAAKEVKKSPPKSTKKTVKKAKNANAKSPKVVVKSPKAVAASAKSSKKVAAKSPKKTAARGPKKAVAAAKTDTPKKAAKSPKAKVARKQTVKIWVQRPKVAKKIPVKKQQQPKRALKPENPTKKTLSRRASKK